MDTRAALTPAQQQLNDLWEEHMRRFIPQMPPDATVIPVSRTIGDDQIADEMVFHVHSTTVAMDWMLPGVAPTGRRVEVPLVAIVRFRDGKIAHEHIYWDQASVLVQLGILSPVGLPARHAGGEGEAAAPWDAADYARHSSLQEAMASEVLALLPLTGSENVLDLGCGDGRLTARIADRLPRGKVLGVDSSPDMVAFATSTFVIGSPRRTNLQFQVADARALAYVQVFDLIVSFNALHWVPDQAKALSGIAAALRRSGRAVLRLVVKGERTSLEAVAERVRHEPRWRSHFEGFTDPYLRLNAAQYAGLAKTHGLRVLSQRTLERSWDFGSDAAFFGFCKAGFGAWTRRLFGEEHDEFVRDVIDAYRRELHAPEAEANVFRFYQMDIMLAPF